MAAATPTPTPNPLGVGCHRWRYELRWEQPSRLSILKNVLGNSVTTYTDYKAPGAGNQDDWPDPADPINNVSEISGAWKWMTPTNPNGPFTRPWDHDCTFGVNCAPATVTDVEGEHPGIYYSKGTWIWPDPGPNSTLSLSYDPRYPPIYLPGVDTTGAKFYRDQYKDPPISSPVPTVVVPGGYGTAGTYDGWAWTLNYGYAAPPGNDVIYGPDPGPPLKFIPGPPGMGLMDETNDNSCGLGCGDSIPGQTGTPLSFPVAWKNGAGVFFTAETQTIQEEDSHGAALVTLFNDPTLGLNQPSWTQNVHRDVVGNTKDVVNWGLMTYSGTSAVCGGGDVNPPASGIQPGGVPVVTVDSGPGDATAIEGYMRLKYYNSAPYPGLAVVNWTPTKHAIAAASDSLIGTDSLGTGGTWGADPKKACNRAYGVILCTDGQSNICNTGTSPLGPDWEWDNPTAPTACELDTTGTDFKKFPPGAAETMYLNARQSPGGAIIRARTFAIGISSDISRCELNRTAYRGRTDANSKAFDGTPNQDAGFLLYDSGDPTGAGGDVRLPHLDSPETAATTEPTNESGATPPSPNRFGPDLGDNNDYAFFADDAKALQDSFNLIVQGLASGDYTTSSPVSGAAVSLGNTVILTSARYPRWQGHIRALDTTDPAAIVDLWDAGDVLTKPSQPWHPTPSESTAPRQLYTWDPSDGHLIEIVKGNAAAIQSLCGVNCVTPLTPAGIDATVIDFIRGIDTRDFILGPGNVKIPNPNKGLPRSWLLGPSINVTPAIVGPAQNYFQAGNVQNHKPFEATYSTRRKLTWIGADDGFLHAFDLQDGAEVVGLMPPNLILNQVFLYKNFLDLSKAVSTATGQNAGFRYDEHTWGIASSLRFADVWFGAEYKTVGFLTEGPGGDLVAAIDITHPYGNLLGRPAVPGPGLAPPDMNYGAFVGLNAGKPVDILWTKNSADYAGLSPFTWSVPAVANIDFSTSRMTFGAGINPMSLINAQKNADIFVVDPTTGALVSTTAIAPAAAPSPVVGHQTFTDSIIFQTTAPGFQNDNLADLSVQGDENGRVNALWPNGSWATPFSKVFIDLNAAAKTLLGTDSPQPLYYSPAANGLGKSGLQVYALGSGSFYETSPTVSGWNVNRISAVDPPLGSGYNPADPGYTFTPLPFVPTLFVATSKYKVADVANFAQSPLGANVTEDLRPFVSGKVIAGIPLQPTDPTYDLSSVPPHTSLGIHSQVTASPLLVGSATTNQVVFFTVYDPDYGCNGYSYVIKAEFTVDAVTHEPTFGATTVYAAGAGAASGFVVTEKGAFVGQSGVKKNEATLVQVDIPKPSLPGAPTFRPVWWKEQR
jgi:hypothetical protein